MTEPLTIVTNFNKLFKKIFVRDGKKERKCVRSLAHPFDGKVSSAPILVDAKE